MKQLFKVTGMTCDACAEIVRGRLSKVSGIKNITVSLATEQAEIESDQPVPIVELKTTLKDTIYNINDIAEKIIAPQAELLEQNRQLTTDYITAVAAKDYNTISNCVAEDFKFYGMINYNSASEFISMLKEHAANPATDIVVKNDIKAIFTNSNETYVIYDLVTRNSHSVPCIEHLKIDNGRISSTELKIQQFSMQQLIQSLKKEKSQLH
ncbi:MAG: cation transporter [Bacteroidetes bacterium]|nr:cation transporter [Bacteroidota bacterium]